MSDDKTGSGEPLAALRCKAEELLAAFSPGDDVERAIKKVADAACSAGNWNPGTGNIAKRLGEKLHGEGFIIYAFELGYRP